MNPIPGNAALMTDFKVCIEHFLDVKGYLTNADFLTENGVTLTDKDNEYLAQGKIPPSLLNNSPTDDVHMNDTGYARFAKCVYDKMRELGYVG